MAFSPDGRTLAGGGFSFPGDGVVYLWDTADGTLRHTLAHTLEEEHGGHTDVHDVAFSPDGRLLAAAGADGVVRLWDADTRILQHVLASAAEEIHGLAFSPDGRLLAAAAGRSDPGGGLVLLWAVDPHAPAAGALHAAAAAGNPDAVARLLRRGVPVDARTPVDDRTPLHLAAAGGHWEATGLLVQAGADPIRPDRDARTPAHLAAAGRHHCLAAYLASRDPRSFSDWTRDTLQANLGAVLLGAAEHVAFEVAFEMVKSTILAQAGGAALTGIALKAAVVGTAIAAPTVLLHSGYHEARTFAEWVHRCRGREVLTLLHEATGGPQWTHRDHWLDRAAPLDRWHGVTTDSLGRITALDLGDNNLVGILPVDLQRLEELSLLALADNPLHGCIPAALYDVPRHDLDQLALPACE